jgi:quinol monooxygenase YgiN
MIVLSGTFTAKPGAAATLVTLAAALLPPSRAEPGCIRYDFLQDALNPSRFVFFELWQTRRDLNEHFEKPYFKVFAEQFPALIEGEAEIVTYESPGPIPAFER